MASSHLKRIVAPKTWQIVRKTTKMISRPKPNGQKMELTMPVVFIMRELLGLVDTAAQARKILRTQPVTVNGKRIYDTDSAVGFMDVLAVGGKGYRMLINESNILTVVPVPASEDFIIQKITGKTSLGKNKTQVNFSSGRNIIVAKDEYKVGDSVTFGKDGKVAAHFALANGASVLFTGGSHIGKVGVVESITGNVIMVKTGEQVFETSKRHAFVVGKGKPSITLG